MNRSGSSAYETYCRYKKVIDAISIPRTRKQISIETKLAQSTIHKILHILKKHELAQIDHFITPTNGRGGKQIAWVKTEKE